MPGRNVWCSLEHSDIFIRMCSLEKVAKGIAYQAAISSTVDYLKRHARSICTMEEFLGERARLRNATVPTAVAGVAKLRLREVVQLIHPHMIAASTTL
jgi:hypothetical protein